MIISRRAEVAPFLAMQMMSAANHRAEQGLPVYHLEVGQPGVGAPLVAQQAVTGAMATGALGYTEALGLPALRARIARHYLETQGVTIDPARVIITAGSSAGFILAFSALFDPGQIVAIADPGYPSYRNILLALGIRVLGMPARPEDGYQPTPHLLSQAGPMNGLLVASPANPTGTVLSQSALRDLIDWCAARQVSFISDEIYHGLTYGTPAVSALTLTDDVIVINSFSKYHAMTGWRIGWMVVPTEMVPVIERLAQNLFICPPHVAQVAALAAMDCLAEAEANRALYARNRQVLLAALHQGGVTRIAPSDGAFYLYADVSDLTDNSLAFCQRLLTETGVAITPGIDFDPGRGQGTVRLSYAKGEAEVAAAAAQLGAWLARQTRKPD